MSRINFDNKQVIIVDHGEEELRDSLNFCFKMLNLSEFAGYRLSNKQEHDGNVYQVIYLAKYKSASITPFPSFASPNTVIGFVSDWLAEADYPAYPNFDGSEYKGFKITNEFSYHETGIIDGVEISPEWCLYGK